MSKHEKSQREVADAIGVSPQTFNTWCQGVALPRFGKIQLLADYFHIPRSALIDEQPSDVGISVEMSNYEEDLFRKYRSLDQHQRELVDDLVYTLYNSNNKK